MKKCFSLLVGTFLLIGCGSQNAANTGSIQDLPPVGTVGTLDGAVVKSRATFQIQSGSNLALRTSPLNWLVASAYAGTSGTVPVTVVNAPSASMSLDSSQFVIPEISNSVLDFGYLGISALKDNDLKVCGSNGHSHCGTAFIRMYTTGTAGAGLYNTDDGYGVPIQAGLPSSQMGTVGLNVQGALVLQSVELHPNMHVVSLADFDPTPHYDVQADFTDAGAGSYSTTLVVEYGLAP